KKQKATLLVFANKKNSIALIKYFSIYVTSIIVQYLSTTSLCQTAKLLYYAPPFLAEAAIHDFV
ncbi:MAG: hypothetical protein NWQ48_09520, partial [Alishewanella sp.]|nr:hypothetical protein [Alishewanella sp.]